MCHEAENQMEVILDGVKNKQFKAALILLAQTQDKNFKNLDEQLEKISNLIVSNKIDTDIKIEELKKETKVNCTSHKQEMKIDIDSKISSVKDEVTTVKKSVEVVSFFSKYPKLLIILGVGLVFLIGFALGNSQLLNLFKIA